MKEHVRLVDYDQMEDSYCSHSLNAINFVDDNMLREERRKYLAHIENCAICIQYIKSLRRDFSVVEELVPPMGHEGSSGEDYVEKIKFLVANFSDARSGILSKLLKAFQYSLVRKLR